MQRNGILYPTVVRNNPKRRIPRAEQEARQEVEFQREFREYLAFARQSLEIEANAFSRKIRE